MSDQEEYEVESIREARVEAMSRSKKAKLGWKYLVRWKGYKAEDDTWEPIDSFNGSEDIVKAFWERAQTNGRDINNLALFKAGETFHPIGPPKRPKRKSMNDVSTADVPQNPEPSLENIPPVQKPSKSSQKRRHISPEPVENSRKERKRSRNDTARHTPNTHQPSPSLDRGNTSSAIPPVQIPADKLSKAGSSRQKKVTKTSSPEIIPDSDEEMNLSSSMMDYLRSEHSFKKPAVPAVSSQRNRDRTGERTPGDKPEHGLDSSQSTGTLPPHRARTSNPLVKLVDYAEADIVSDAITAKRHAIEHLNATPSSSKAPSPDKRTKPGPGRSSSGLLKPQKNKSSLLTFEKGALKSIKGKYTQDKPIDLTLDENDSMDTTENLNSSGIRQEESNIAEVPPSGEELLQMAGLNATTTETLPDFEDDNTEHAETTVVFKPESRSPTQKAEEKSEIFPNSESLAQAKDTLFPSTASTEIMPAFSNAWKRPTIFGPLTLGSEPVFKSDHPKTSPLLLNLDNSLSIPIRLSELSHLSTHQSSETGLKGTPGKFYRSEAALALLGTVRAGGTSAFATVDEQATAEEQNHFAHFTRRLEAGDLFVAATGLQILAFCSTGNTLLSHRLNAPPSLLNDPSKILVAEIEVENYSGYADATANADDRRWSQSIAAN